MSGPGGIRCADCVFMVSSGTDVHCRRYPPVLVALRKVKEPDDTGIRVYYPNVNPFGDWCGEHSKLSASASSVPSVKPETA